MLQLAASGGASRWIGNRLLFHFHCDRGGFRCHAFSILGLGQPLLERDHTVARLTQLLVRRQERHTTTMERLLVLMIMVLELGGDLGSGVGQ